MSSLRWYLAVLLIVTGALIGGATLIERYTIDHLLYNDAVTTGRNWTQYLASNVRDLEEIAAGQNPSAASMAFFEQAKRVGQVFLYKIYDADGRVRFASHDLPAGETDEENLSQHNEEAAEAIEHRQPVIEVKEGDPPSRPPFFSEAYVPLVRDGRLLAVIETYIDQAEKRQQFYASFTIATIALGFLVACSFGIPGVAWYRRSREKQLAESRVHFLAHRDALTGLLNRNALTEALEQALSKLRVGSSELAVHYVDLDRFKDINDTFGHDVGDILIKTVADRLCALAGSGDFVARLGGDEFAVVQTGIGGQPAAESLAASDTGSPRLPLFAQWARGRNHR